MNTFLHYLARFTYAPRSAVRDLKEDPNSVRYGVWSILFISVLYSLSSLGNHFFGYRQCCWVDPLIKVPEASYWLIQTSWEIPLMFTFAILPAGIADRLTFRKAVPSSYFRLFAAMGFITFTVQFLNMWLPETIGLLIGRDFLPQIFNDLRQAIFVPWWLGLATLSVAIMADTPWVKAFLVSLVSYIPLPALVALLIR
jgi:hypothetical protein